MPPPNFYIFDDSEVEQARLLLQAELFRTYIREHARDFVPQPPARILDLGCGIGHLAIELHALYPQADLVGIDRNPEMLATARQQPALAPPPQVRFVVGNIQEALPPGPFNLIYASMILTYLSDLPRAVDLIYAALAPGGTLWVKDMDSRSQEAAHDPDYKYLIDLFFNALRKAGSHPDLATELPPLLTAAGFSTLRVVDDEVYPLGGDTIEGDSFLAGLMVGVRTSHKMLSRFAGVPEEEILRRVDRVVAAAQSSKEPLGTLHTINILAQRPPLAVPP